MAREYVTPPCGRPETSPLTAAPQPGRRVKRNPMVPVEHQEVTFGDRTKTFTHTEVKDSVTALAVWVAANGRFQFLLQEEMKKIGPVLTTASGYLNGKAEEEAPLAAAQRVLKAELGVKAPPEALTCPPVALTAMVLAYPNLTGEAGQKAYGFLLRQAPQVRADKVIWSEDLFPRSVDDLPAWQARVGRHGPVVTAVLAMGQWLTLAGYATPMGEATAAFLALHD